MIIKSYALVTVWPVIFGIYPLPAHRQPTVRCDIHRAIPACYSSDSDGAMQPDHGGVLPSRLGAVIEVNRSFHAISGAPKREIQIRRLFAF